MHIPKQLLLYCCFLMLAACARQDKPVGDDVRQMMRAQIYDKSAASKPVNEPIPREGMKAQIAIDKYLEVGKQKKQANNININLGN